MPWVKVFVVFFICHMVGDYWLQTEWQALNKHGGLTGAGAAARRALFSHVTTYTLAFVPAFIWLRPSMKLGLIWLVPLIFVPHLIQDDGTLLAAYARRVKKADITQNPILSALLDQSFHFVVLFLTALLAGS